MKVNSQMKNILGRSVTVVIGAMLIAIGVGPSMAEAVDCVSPITACGCTINAPGSFTVAGTLLNATADCIDIAAANVILDGANATLSGPGIATPGAFGIFILPSASNAIVQNFTATNFSVGVRSLAPNTVLLNFQANANNKGVVLSAPSPFLGHFSANGNNVVGIQINPNAFSATLHNFHTDGNIGFGTRLNHANGAFLVEFTADNNGTFGTWLQGASRNALQHFEALNNGTAGIFLGCNPAGPNGTACFGSDRSIDNTVYGNIETGVPSDVSNTGTQKFGAAISLGNIRNHVLVVRGTGNVTDDALDENPLCRSNRWFLNQFTLTNPTNATPFCIH